MYPPTVPPTSVVTTMKLKVSGATAWTSASPTGGAEATAATAAIATMTTPRTTTTRSIAVCARRTTKTAIAIAAETVAPILGSRPVMASTPRPVPPTFAMLNASPPTTTSTTSTTPAPGRTWPARSCT